MLLAKVLGLSYIDALGIRYTVNHIGFTFDDRRTEIELTSSPQKRNGHKIKIRLRSVADILLLAEFINLTKSGYYLDEKTA